MTSGCCTSKATPLRGPAPRPIRGTIRELMEHNLAQVRELLTRYGKIDLIFFDGAAGAAQATGLAARPQNPGHPRRNEDPGAEAAGPADARSVGGELHDGHRMALQADERGLQVGHGADQDAHRGPREGRQPAVERRPRSGRRDSLRADPAPPRAGALALRQRRGDLRHSAVDRYQRRLHLVHQGEGGRHGVRLRDQRALGVGHLAGIHLQERAGHEGHRGRGRRPDGRKPLLVQGTMQGNLEAATRRPARSGDVRPAALHRLQMAQSDRDPPDPRRADTGRQVICAHELHGELL